MYFLGLKVMLMQTSRIFLEPNFEISVGALKHEIGINLLELANARGFAP